jgi:hypothetical protein
MHSTNNFLRIAALCSFATVITTLGIHLVFNFETSTFEQRAMLYQNPWYLLNRWWVIAHCLLALVAMWGVYIVQRQYSPAWSGLGLLFFIVFALTEILRQIMVLIYLNGLRRQYLSATEPLAKELLKSNIEAFVLISAALFGVFILAFAMSNFLFSLSLLGGNRFDSILSDLLMLWAFGSIVAFGNYFWKIPQLSSGLEIWNAVFQPAMRVVLGVWLWKQRMRKYDAA